MSETYKGRCKWWVGIGGDWYCCLGVGVAGGVGGVRNGEWSAYMLFSELGRAREHREIGVYPNPIDAMIAVEAMVGQVKNSCDTSTEKHP